jgi:hypothetical protein
MGEGDHFISAGRSDQVFVELKSLDFRDQRTVPTELCLGNDASGGCLPRTRSGPPFEQMEQMALGT